MTPLTMAQSSTILAGVSELSHAVHQCAVEHGWWESGDRNMGESIMLMVTELAEAFESVRNSEPALWYKPHDGDGNSAGPLDQHGTPMKPEGIASEFADTIIRILDICQFYEIPVARALIEKHNYNLTRPYRHGGKTA